LIELIGNTEIIIVPPERTSELIEEMAFERTPRSDTIAFENNPTSYNSLNGSLVTFGVQDTRNIESEMNILAVFIIPPAAYKLIDDKSRYLNSVVIIS